MQALADMEALGGSASSDASAPMPMEDFLDQEIRKRAAGGGQEPSLAGDAGTLAAEATFPGLRSIRDLLGAAGTAIGDRAAAAKSAIGRPTTSFSDELVKNVDASQEAYRGAQERHPLVDVGLNVGAGLLPMGAAGAVGKGVGIAERAASRLAPRAASLASKIPLHKLMASSARGALAGGALGATSASEAGRDIGEGGGAGAMGGAVLSPIMEQIGNSARGAANRLRGSQTDTGADISVLESHGARPSAKPFQPVEGLPDRLADLPASPEGRGTAAKRSADAITQDLRAKRQSAGRRLGYERGNAERHEGGRLVDTNDPVAIIDKHLAREDLQPEVKARLKQVRKILTSTDEPTMDIESTRTAQNAGSIGGVEEKIDPITTYPTQTSNVRTTADRVVESSPDVDFDTKSVRERGRMTGSAVTAEPGEPITIDRIERPGGPASSTTASSDRLTVPTDRVYGKPEVPVTTEQPISKVVPARKLREVKTLLDQYANMDTAQLGMSKDSLPFAEVAGSLRGLLGGEGRAAPGMAAADKRYSHAIKPIERVEELGGLGDTATAGTGRPVEDDKSLASRLARQGTGSATAGMEADDLGRLREQYPGDVAVYDQSDPGQMPEVTDRRSIGEVMDDPRLLLAAERLKLKGWNPLSRGSAPQVVEPIVGRGIYPALRAIEGADPTRAGLPAHVIVRAARKKKERDRAVSK